MAVLIFAGLVALAVVVTWLWREVQALKAHHAMQLIDTRQEQAMARLRAQRREAEAAARRLIGRW
jgi:hypothetical protein